ncbi:MAG: phenylacetate--CoA ligase family protein, partial [Planctomycetota bacterium]
RKTSGSTGVSLRFFVDSVSAEHRRGVTLYRDEWSGWRLGEWRAMVWGNPEYVKSRRSRVRNAVLERTFYLDTLRMDEGMMEGFARTVLRRRPSLLFGHAHSLYLFSRFWKENGFPPYRPRGVISTAMVLHDHERRGIAEVFGENIFDRYGCEEVSLIASECEAHRGLHVNTDSLIVEILRDDGSPARPGEEGAVVVTDLWNYGMPFIRYVVGDRAVASGEACPCGRTYPLLERVAGRIADYLVTPEGAYVSGISLTENFATLIPGLYQAQIVQDLRDHVLIRVVPKADFGEESRREIARLIAERFGPHMRHEVEVVEKIPQEPSGKYRFAICKVASRLGRIGSPE